MTLASEGMLDLGTMRLEYRMIGPRPDAAPTIVMLHADPSHFPLLKPAFFM